MAAPALIGGLVVPWTEGVVPPNGETFMNLVTALPGIDSRELLRTCGELVRMCVGETPECLDGGVRRFSDPAVLYNARAVLGHVAQTFPLLTTFPTQTGNWIVQAASLEFRVGSVETTLPVLEDSLARIHSNAQHAGDVIRFVSEQIPRRDLLNSLYERLLLYRDDIGRNPHSGNLWERFLALVVSMNQPERAAQIAGEMLKRPLLVHSTMETLYSTLFTTHIRTATAEQLLGFGLVTQEEMQLARAGLPEAARDDADQQAQAALWTHANTSKSWEPFLRYYEVGFEGGWTPEVPTAERVNKWKAYLKGAQDGHADQKFIRMLFDRSTMMFPDYTEFWRDWLTWTCNAKHNTLAAKKQEIELILGNGLLTGIESVSIMLLSLHALYMEANDELDAAIDSYEHVLTLAPTDTSFVRGLISCHMRSGDMDEAILAITTHLDTQLALPAGGVDGTSSRISARAELIGLLAEVNVRNGLAVDTARNVFVQYGQDMQQSSDLARVQLEFDAECVSHDHKNQEYHQRVRETFARARQSDFDAFAFSEIAKVYLKYLDKYGTRADAREVFELRLAVQA